MAPETELRDASPVYRSMGEAALVFLLPGVIQGIALWALTDWLDEHDPDPAVVALLLAVLVAPVAHFLTTTRATRLPAALYALGLGVAVGGLYWIANAAFGVNSEAMMGQVLALCAFSSFLIAWISAPFFRTLVERKAGLMAYKDLFEFAWNLPVVGLVGGFFTVVFWIVLAVWAGLFQLIGIEFFSDLFFGNQFGIPLTTGAFAVATGIVRERESIVLALRSVLFALLKVLAPVLAFATALFAVAALVNGLDALWDNWSSTAVMVAAMAVAVILSNAVAGVEGEPDHPLLRWSVRVQSLVLPVLGGFAIYGLWLRIDEYGLTVERVWAMIVVAIACAYALAYAACALLPKGWAMYRRANIGLALGLLVLAVLVQSPLVNAWDWAARDQVARLQQGKVTAQDFDYAYLQYDLGTAGQRALARIEADDSLPGHDTILEQVAAVRSAEDRWEYNQDRPVSDEDIAAVLASGAVPVYPTGATLSADFLDEIRYNLTADQCLSEQRRCAILVTDMFNAPGPQYVFLDAAWSWMNVTLYVRRDDYWQTYSALGWSFADDAEIDAFFAALAEGGFAPGEVTLRTIETGAGPIRFAPGDATQLEVLSVAPAAAAVVPEIAEEGGDTTAD